MSEFGSVGARVQGLDVLEQALVLAGIAQGHSESGTFTPKQLQDLFIDLGLPSPNQISNLIASLNRRQLVRRGPSRGTWRLTPIGREAANQVLSNMEIAALLVESAASTAPTLGHIQHSVISPALAPLGLVPSLKQFLEDHPFERNVFGMTRFPESDPNGEDDPVQPALDVARSVCGMHGLEFHLASDRAIDDDLWTNVAAHMWASKYGIAFFEDRRGRGVNYNLTIEVGGMLMTGRRCALMKDHSIPRLPTDLVGRIYKSVDLDNPETVSAALHAWIRDDLNLGSCSNCPK